MLADFQPGQMDLKALCFLLLANDLWEGCCCEPVPRCHYWQCTACTLCMYQCAMTVGFGEEEESWEEDSE